MKLKKQCNAINENGSKCLFESAIDGYCMIHYLKEKNNKSIKTINYQVGKEEGNKEGFLIALDEIEKIILKCLDDENKYLDNLFFPMEKYNVTICLNNMAVEINKGINKLRNLI